MIHCMTVPRLIIASGVVLQREQIQNTEIDRYFTHWDGETGKYVPRDGLRQLYPADYPADSTFGLPSFTP